MVDAVDNSKMVEQVAVKADDIPFATNGLASPTIYADIIRGTAIMDGVAKVSFVEHKMNAQDDSVNAVHVLSLVVPVAQMRTWGKYFTNLADHIGLPQNAE